MKHFRKLTGPYFAWLVLFVLIPLVLIAIYAFTTSGNPVKTLNFTLMNFAKINESTYIKVFIKSIEMGILTTGVCLLFAEPIIRLFVTDAAVVHLGVRFLKLVSLFYLMPSLTNGIQGGFRGLGDLKITLNSSTLNMAGRVAAGW